MKPHFPLTLCTLAFATFIAAHVRAEPLISEFMAANSRTLIDEDGDTPDWIEIHNPDATPAHMTGWYLTDSATRKTKWSFPAVTIPPRGYLIVFASGKNRRDPARALHTNFSLEADGEHLALVRPDGLTCTTEFSPRFPAQASDVSYGRTPTPAPDPVSAAFLRVPTPGMENTEAGTPPPTGQVEFSHVSGPFAASFELTLSGARPGEEIRYVLAPASPKGAAWVSEPTNLTWRYEAPIPITESIIVRAAIFSANGAKVGPSRTAHYLREADNVPGAARSASALPSVVLGLHGYGHLHGDRTTVPGWVHVLEAAPARSIPPTSPSTASAALLRVRGNSSATFPKKGYNIELVDEAGGGNALPLLGLGTADSWALVSPWWYDRTYVHNALMYTLSNRIGRWAPRTRFVEVFCDADGVLGPEDYAGVSLLTERIKAGRLGLASLEPTDTSAPAITGGYLLKIDVPDGGDFSFITDHGLPDMDSAAVVVVSPDADELVPAQREYIRDYVQRMENALFASRDSGWRDRSYTDYIDVASWVDHHLLQTLSANLDCFFHSAYFHKNRGGRMAAGPIWDFDRALGSYDPRTQPPEGWDPGHAEMWGSSWFGVLARDPEFQQAWVDRWQSLRASVLATRPLETLCDALAAEVTTEAADRDAARWPDNASETGSGFAGEIARLKDWITRRASWIDEQFVAPPSLTGTGATLKFTAPPGAQLVYTLDGSDPRSLGGAIAPTARVSEGPLTIAATANIHVRSYDASRADVFPGSPWSRAVDGASSTPLAPKSRLVNLSTRGLAGTAENALLTGVVIQDTHGKRILARAVGPGLTAFGASNVVAEPELTLLDAGGGELVRNLGWQNSAHAMALTEAFRESGAFPLPAASADSAIATEVRGGTYTVRAASRVGAAGVCLSELYELDGNGRIASVAIRARVGAGDGVLIAGIVIKGAAHQRLLVRAVGPGLAGFGVEGALPDPVVAIHAGTTLLGSTEDSRSADERAAIDKAAAAVGAFSVGTDENGAAMLITVPPGAYTIQVASRSAAEGHVLLEIHDVP